MKIENETDDEPIYEAQNGCGSCGPIDPSLRARWHQQSQNGANPLEVKDGPDVRGYGGKLASQGSQGDSHTLTGLTHHTITLSFFATPADAQPIRMRTHASHSNRYAFVKENGNYRIDDRGPE